jgi:hypothetical protein
MDEGVLRLLVAYDTLAEMAFTINGELDKYKSDIFFFAC